MHKHRQSGYSDGQSWFIFSPQISIVFVIYFFLSYFFKVDWSLYSVTWGQQGYRVILLSTCHIELLSKHGLIIKFPFFFYIFFPPQMLYYFLLLYYICIALKFLITEEFYRFLGTEWAWYEQNILSIFWCQLPAWTLKCKNVIEVFKMWGQKCKTPCSCGHFCTDISWKWRVSTANCQMFLGSLNV